MINKKKQIKFVAVRPDGNICGPVGNEAFVIDSLCIGYKRVTESQKSIEEIWPEIQKIGYTVKKAKIILLE